ncbi:MAG TPA: transcription termination factor NusA [Planctomycetota bacterium]|nr:transcription termination factor NusA [Planctomycetota bacterium]
MADSTELLRLIDSLHRDKGIDKEILVTSIEQALHSAARKRLQLTGELSVRINRVTGAIEAYEDGRRIDPTRFGRIAAQSGKQVMLQKIREAERDVVYNEFVGKVDTLVNGTVQRYERAGEGGRGRLFVNLGRAEGVVPVKEQVREERYRQGDRIRAYVIKVQKLGQKVLIVLSRTHVNLVRELFSLEVPEISDRIVEVKSLVREPGYRTKIAVFSNDPRVDPIGACVGVRGSRIRSIVDELNGEKIDIVRWSDQSDIFIRSSLSPAEISQVELERDEMIPGETPGESRAYGTARVIVPEEQLKLAIGKKGQNVRLTARLTHWNIEILTESQARILRDRERAEIGKIPFLSQDQKEALILASLSSLRQIIQRGEDGMRMLTNNKLTAEEITQTIEYAKVRQKEFLAELAAQPIEIPEKPVEGGLKFITPGQTPAAPEGAVAPEGAPAETAAAPQAEPAPGEAPKPAE